MFYRRFCRVLSSFLAGTLCCGGVSSASGDVTKDESVQIHKERGVVVGDGPGNSLATYERILMNKSTVISVGNTGREKDLGKNSNWKMAATAAGAVVGGVALLGSIYLGKLAYDVKRDVNNLFEWLDGVVGKEAIEDGLYFTRDFFVFENVVGAIRKLLPVRYQPVFSLLIGFVDKNEFVREAEIRYLNKSSEDSGYDDSSVEIINNPVHSSKNNKVVTSFFYEEKLDN